MVVARSGNRLHSVQPCLRVSMSRSFLPLRVSQCCRRRSLWSDEEAFSAGPEVRDRCREKRSKLLTSLRAVQVTALPCFSRRLHARLQLCEDAVTACVFLLVMYIIPSFTPLRVVGVDAPPCLPGASTCFQSTQRWCHKLAFRSNSACVEFAHSLRFLVQVVDVLVAMRTLTRGASLSRVYSELTRQVCTVVVARPAQCSLDKIFRVWRELAAL